MPLSARRSCGLMSLPTALGEDVEIVIRRKPRSRGGANQVAGA